MSNWLTYLQYMVVHKLHTHWLFIRRTNQALEHLAESDSRIVVHRKSVEKKFTASQICCQIVSIENSPKKYRYWNFFSLKRKSHPQQFPFHSLAKTREAVVSIFKQLWLGLNRMLHAVPAELLTVLSCDNFSNPDISQKHRRFLQWLWLMQLVFR